MKIKLKNVIFLIGAIISIICLTIMQIYQMPFLCKTFIEHFGPFFGPFLAAVLDYGLISLIVLCIIIIKEIISCKWWR